MEDEVVSEVESPQFDLNMTLASPTPSSAPFQGLYLQETSFDGSVASTQSSRRSYASVTISSLQGQGPEDWSIGNVLESKSPERQRRIARLKRPPTRSTESVQIPPQKDPRKEEIWLVNHAVDVERRLRLELLEVLDELEEEKQRTKEKQKKLEELSRLPGRLMSTIDGHRDIPMDVERTTSRGGGSHRGDQQDSEHTSREGKEHGEQRPATWNASASSPESTRLKTAQADAKARNAGLREVAEQRSRTSVGDRSVGDMVEEEVPGWLRAATRPRKHGEQRARRGAMEGGEGGQRRWDLLTREGRRLGGGEHGEEFLPKTRALKQKSYSRYVNDGSSMFGDVLPTPLPLKERLQDLKGTGPVAGGVGPALLRDCQRHVQQALADVPLPHTQPSPSTIVREEFSAEAQHGQLAALFRTHAQRLRAFQLPLLALIANFRVAGPLLNAIKEAYEAAIKSYARAFDEAMGQVDYPGADVELELRTRWSLAAVETRELAAANQAMREQLSTHEERQRRASEENIALEQEVEEQTELFAKNKSVLWQLSEMNANLAQQVAGLKGYRQSLGEQQSKFREVEEIRKRAVSEIADLEMKMELLRFEVKTATARSEEYRAVANMLKWKQEEMMEMQFHTLKAQEQRAVEQMLKWREEAEAQKMVQDENSLTEEANED